MEDIIEKLKKKGLVQKRKSFLLDVMDYDFSNPEDCLDYLTQGLLDRLTDYMVKHGITRSDLARKLGVSRQAVSKIFTGNGSPLNWIVKAIVSLGGQVNLKTYFPEEKKTAKSRSNGEFSLIR